MPHIINGDIVTPDIAWIFQPLPLTVPISHSVQGYQIGTFLNDIIKEIEVFPPPYSDGVFKYFFKYRRRGEEKNPH